MAVQGKWEHEKGAEKVCLLHRHKQDCKLETTATNLAKDALEIAACQCFAYQTTVFAGNYLSKASTNKNTRDIVTGAPLSVGRVTLRMVLGDQTPRQCEKLGVQSVKAPEPQLRGLWCCAEGRWEPCLPSPHSRNTQPQPTSSSGQFWLPS